MIFRTVGEITLLEAVLMLIPLVVSLIYGESCFLSFLITIGIAVAIGLPLTLCFRKVNSAIYAKEGFITVSFAWVLLSLIGALPFLISFYPSAPQAPAFPGNCRQTPPSPFLRLSQALFTRTTPSSCRETQKKTGAFPFPCISREVQKPRPLKSSGCSEPFLPWRGKKPLISGKRV